MCENNSLFLFNPYPLLCLVLHLFKARICIVINYNYMLQYDNITKPAATISAQILPELLYLSVLL